MAKSGAPERKPDCEPDAAKGSDRIELRRLVYRYEEAARLLSLSAHTLQCLVDEGQIERVYLRPRNRMPRITADSMMEYLKRRKRAGLGLGV